MVLDQWNNTSWELVGNEDFQALLQTYCIRDSGWSLDSWLPRPLDDADTAKVGDPLIYKMSFIEKLF